MKPGFLNMNLLQQSMSKIQSALSEKRKKDRQSEIQNLILSSSIRNSIGQEHEFYRTLYDQGAHRRTQCKSQLQSGTFYNANQIDDPVRNSMSRELLNGLLKQRALSRGKLRQDISNHLIQRQMDFSAKAEINNIEHFKTNKDLKEYLEACPKQTDLDLNSNAKQLELPNEGSLKDPHLINSNKTVKMYAECAKMEAKLKHQRAKSQQPAQGGMTGKETKLLDFLDSRNKLKLTQNINQNKLSAIKQLQSSTSSNFFYDPTNQQQQPSKEQKVLTLNASASSGKLLSQANQHMFVQAKTTVHPLKMQFILEMSQFQKVKQKIVEPGSHSNRDKDNENQNLLNNNVNPNSLKKGKKGRYSIMGNLNEKQQMMLDAKPIDERTPPKAKLQKKKDAENKEREKNSTLEAWKKEQEEKYNLLVEETNKMALDMKLAIPSAFSLNPATRLEAVNLAKWLSDSLERIQNMEVTANHNTSASNLSTSEAHSNVQAPPKLDLDAQFQLKQQCIELCFSEVLRQTEQVCSERAKLLEQLWQWKCDIVIENRQQYYKLREKIWEDVDKANHGIHGFYEDKMAEREVEFNKAKQTITEQKLNLEQIELKTQQIIQQEAQRDLKITQCQKVIQVLQRKLIHQEKLNARLQLDRPKYLKRPSEIRKDRQYYGDQSVDRNSPDANNKDKNNKSPSKATFQKGKGNSHTFTQDEDDDNEEEEEDANSDTSQANSSQQPLKQQKQKKKLVKKRNLNSSQDDAVQSMNSDTMNNFIEEEQIKSKIQQLNSLSGADELPIGERRTLMYDIGVQTDETQIKLAMSQGNKVSTTTQSMLNLMNLEKYHILFRSNKSLENTADEVNKQSKISNPMRPKVYVKDPSDPMFRINKVFHAYYFSNRGITQSMQLQMAKQNLKIVPLQITSSVKLFRKVVRLVNILYRLTNFQTDRKKKRRANNSNKKEEKQSALTQIQQMPDSSQQQNEIDALLKIIDGIPSLTKEHTNPDVISEQEDQSLYLMKCMEAYDVKAADLKKIVMVVQTQMTDLQNQSRFLYQSTTDLTEQLQEAKDYNEIHVRDAEQSERNLHNLKKQLQDTVDQLNQLKEAQSSQSHQNDGQRMVPNLKVQTKIRRGVTCDEPSSTGMEGVDEECEQDEEEGGSPIRKRGRKLTKKKTKTFMKSPKSPKSPKRNRSRNRSKTVKLQGMPSDKSDREKDGDNNNNNSKKPDTGRRGKTKTVKINDGLHLLKRFRDAKMKKFKNFMAKKVVCKQINMVYGQLLKDFRDTKHLQMSDMASYTYNFMMGLFGFPKITEQKFIIFIFSLRKNIAYLRISQFAKFLGVFSKKNINNNYSLLELNHFIGALNYVTNVSQTGLPFLNVDTDFNYFVPSIRALGFVDEFYPNASLPLQNKDLKSEILKEKLPDPTNKNQQGIIDFDVLMMKSLMKFRSLEEETLQIITPIFKSMDLIGQNNINYEEFKILAKHLAQKNKSDEAIEKTFSLATSYLENAPESVYDRVLTLEEMLDMCLQKDNIGIFTAEAVKDFLSIKSDEELNGKFESLKTKWDTGIKNEMLRNLNYFNILTKEELEGWKHMVALINNKVIDRGSTEIKPIIISFEILKREIDAMSIKQNNFNQEIQSMDIS